MLLLKNQTTKSVFNLPQTLDEVSFNYLKDCVKEVEIAPNLCIVAIVTKARIRDIIDTKNNNAGNVNFFVVKRNVNSTSDFVKENKKIYAAPSVIFQGIDCNTPKNQLSIPVLSKFIDSDSTLRMSIMKGDIFKKATIGMVESSMSLYGGDESKQLITTVAETAIVVGFKIIYESDIQGYNSNISLKETGIDNFITPLIATIN